MWKIDKQFSFCYSHRVWVQTLLEDFCAVGDTKCACRRKHGHHGTVHVFLESDKLNLQGMVVDFKMLGWLKDFLDNNVDHREILDSNDPIFHILANGTVDYNTKLFTTKDDEILPLVPVYVPGTKFLTGYNLDTFTVKGPMQEYYDSFFIVDFIPTSERLSEWIFNLVDAKMKTIDVTVSRIDWFETPKSRSTYLRNSTIVDVLED
jgi:6-pyruvoyltetrahydropterin/6-carboxytetrahydropterin synthase